MKANKKSLCESCSNRVVIKFHGENIRSDISKLDCFYEFKVKTSDSKYKKHTNGAEKQQTHISHVIVDECTFYNKINERIKKKVKKNDTDTDDDYGVDSKGDRMYGVTFTNIPGALLP